MRKHRPIAFGETNTGVRDLQRYLVRFGFQSGAGPMSMALEGSTFDGLKQLQRFYGIKEDGAGNETLAFMRRPRCGLRDWRASGPLVGCRWPTNQSILVYEFGRETTDRPPGVGFGAVGEAIAIWNDVLARQHIPLQFERRSTQPQTHLSFEWKEVDDDIGLGDLPVAHADLPPACSVLTAGVLPKPVVFEDNKDWNEGLVGNAFHIISVAVHEIGHVLGLTHDQDPHSVMFANLLPFQNFSTPTSGDEARLLALYS
jgi:hypothetical protein